MVNYQKNSLGYRVDRLQHTAYRSHFVKLMIPAAVFCILSFWLMAGKGEASRCFHHYNPEAWEGDGLAIVMCEQTPDMTECVIKTPEGQELADLLKHGNKDHDRYVWTLYDTLGENFPFAINIVCKSTSGIEFSFNINDGRQWEDGTCTTESCASEIAEKPRVTILATDATASEGGGDTGTYSISRTGDTSSELAVHFSMDGTALPIVDYPAFLSPATIPAGASSTYLTLIPIDDTKVEKSEVARVTLARNEKYDLGTPYFAEITVLDNDKPTKEGILPVWILLEDDK